MANFNRVILAGNLTRDPELSYTPNNTAVCQFGMAINRKWRDRDGNTKDDVCFVDVTSFGRQGETINEYMRKGRPILIEGRLRYQKWTSKEGQNRSKLDVVVESFTFLGDGQGGGGRKRDDGTGQSSGGHEDDGPPPPSDDDIPF